MIRMLTDQQINVYLEQDLQIEQKKKTKTNHRKQQHKIEDKRKNTPNLEIVHIYTQEVGIFLWL